jgi:hypothetical protein
MPAYLNISSQNLIKMKTIKNLNVLVILLGFMATAHLFGCKGDQGDPGLQGEQGQTGAQGPRGEVGSANVLQYEFAKATRQAGAVSVYTITDLPSYPKIYNYLIMVYIEEPGSTLWWHAIPAYLNSTYAQGKPGHYSFFTKAGDEFSIYIQGFTTSGTIIAPVPNFKAKIVLIPTSGIPRRARYSAEFLNDYKAVQKEFNLPD